MGYIKWRIRYQTFDPVPCQSCNEASDKAVFTASRDRCVVTIDWMNESIEHPSWSPFVEVHPA